MGARKKSVSFEEALEKLESLVSSMESGDIPLATLVEKFEEGSNLVKLCEERLKQAELKISKLREVNGEIQMAPVSDESE